MHKSTVFKLIVNNVLIKSVQTKNRFIWECATENLLKLSIY